MSDHDSAGCAVAGVAPAFPQTNKDICCNPAHSSFGCDYTGIPNGTFTDTGGSVADVIPFMYVGGWPGDPSWGSISAVLPYTVWKGGDDALVTAYYGGAKRNVDFFMREASADGLIEFGYCVRCPLGAFRSTLTRATHERDTHERGTDPPSRPSQGRRHTNFNCN
jgi:hypothetical protein